MPSGHFLYVTQTATILLKLANAADRPTGQAESGQHEQCDRARLGNGTGHGGGGGHIRPAADRQRVARDRGGIQRCVGGDFHVRRGRVEHASAADGERTRVHLRVAGVAQRTGQSECAGANLGEAAPTAER